MKEYAVKESWTKLCIMGAHYITRPLLFLKNEWLPCETNKGQLAACRIEGHQFKEFEVYGLRCSFNAVVYEESLISLKGNNFRVIEKTRDIDFFFFKVSF